MSRKFEEFQNPEIQTKIVQHFGIFFQQIKVCRPVGTRNKGFYTNRVPKKQKIGGILYLAAHSLGVFSTFQDQNLKNQKFIAGDVLIKAYQMAPISCGSYLAQWPDSPFKLESYCCWS